MRILKLFTAQPGGVYLMFSTEFWERFSYYGFMGIVVLFMIDSPSHGGLGWSRGDSLVLFGVVTGCVWITPVAGGWVADKLIGARRAVIMGCVGLAAGNLALAAAAFSVTSGAAYAVTVSLFYGGLLALVFGSGMFKSNASALVSEVFQPEDTRREAGFTLFYMGINLGAMIAPLGAGTLGEIAGWGYGFLVAGLGMLIGLAIFLSLSPRFFRREWRRTPRAELGASPRGGLLRDQGVRLILLMALFATVFMIGLMQYGGLLNLYAATAVDRHVLGAEIPATWFLALNPLLVILLGPLFVAFWTSRTALRWERFVAKIATGLCCMAAAFALLSFVDLGRGGALVGLWVLPLFYLILTAGELCVLPAGLVEISRRAPRRALGLLMGIWILTMGIGSVLAGWVGSFTETFSHASVFGGLALLAATSALVLAVLEPHVRGWFGVPGRQPKTGTQVSSIS